MRPDILQKAGTRSSQEYFDLVAANYAHKYELDPAFRERYRVWTGLIDKYAASLSRDALVADVGCGTGGFCRYAAARGFSVVGMDQSAAMLAAAEAAGTAADAGRIRYVRSTLPLADAALGEWRGRVGLLLCSSVLEYVDDYRAALRQFHEMLVPGGVAIFSLPNKASVYRRAQGLVGRLPLARLSYLGHQRHQWLPAEAARELEQVGLRVIETACYALPFHRLAEGVLGQWRPTWLATMFLAVVEKRGAAGR